MNNDDRRLSVVRDDHNGLAMLPAGDITYAFGFSRYGARLETWRAFLHFVLADPVEVEHNLQFRHTDALIMITLALIPEPDNTYDDRAIRVCSPASVGGTTEERHLGYLYEPKVFMYGETIRALGSQTDLPVGCHGLLELFHLAGYADPDEARKCKPSMDSPLSFEEMTTFGYGIGSIRLSLPYWKDLQNLRLLPAPHA